MDKLVVPEWALKLLKADGEPYQISDDDFLKLTAYLGSSPRKYVEVPGPNYQATRSYNDTNRLLKYLMEYNKSLRENRKPVTVLRPSSDEEAAAQGYVTCSTVVRVLHSEFTNAGVLSKYLDEREQAIRTHKPSKGRRMVHAGDLLNRMREELDAEDAARAKIHGDKPDRKRPQRKLT